MWTKNPALIMWSKHIGSKNGPVANLAIITIEQWRKVPQLQFC